MKHTQFIIGLLAGTVIGGSVVASTGASTISGGNMDAEQVKVIVRDVIMNEPKLIVESVQKMQMDEQKKQMESLSDVLKDPAIREQVFNDPNAATTGPKDAKHVMVEFFDYNCGACKMMYKSIEEVMKLDKSIRIVFHEYPIFGPVSDTNAKIGLAVNRLYPNKYFDFHVKMITHEGKTDDKVALGFVKDLGMDVAKVKAESEKKEVADIIDSNRKLGEKLHIQGTPTLVIGDEIIPHGMSSDELEGRFRKIDEGKSAAHSEDADSKLEIEEDKPPAD